MDISTNGTNTIIHDITPSPRLHMTFSTMVNMIATHTFTRAMLYMPL